MTQRSSVQIRPPQPRTRHGSVTPPPPQPAAKQAAAPSAPLSDCSARGTGASRSPGPRASGSPASGHPVGREQRPGLPNGPPDDCAEERQPAGRRHHRLQGAKRMGSRQLVGALAATAALLAAAGVARSLAVNERQLIAAGPLRASVEDRADWCQPLVEHRHPGRQG